MLRRLADWFSRKRPTSIVLATTEPTSASTSPRLCQRCEKPQVLHITLMKQGEIGEQTHLCEECGKQFLSDLDVAERGETIKSFREFAPNDEVEMAIEKVIISEKHESQMIVFREADGNRRLQFVLGIFEATCVERILNGESYPRPLTHDSWFASIRALGATVASVRIHDRRESTFFAELTLNRGSETATVDVRPSDGLALTLKARVKFFVLERLLREAT